MFRIGLCQIDGSVDKKANLKLASEYVKRAADGGAQVVSLPEMWNCPYAAKFFRTAAEPCDGQTVEFMSRLAEELKIYLIGGSIPEIEDGRIYNTSFSFDREGRMIGRFRKVHLFDVDIEGGIRFKESDTLTPGNEMLVLDTDLCKIGVAICYDVRFPEWFRKMALSGAKLVVLPAAFNMTTGPAHWDLTMRARALDNQIYLAANARAGDSEGPYHSYGNSCIVSPWGDFVSHGDEKTAIIYGDIDPDYVEKIREQLPLLRHRRPELY